MNALSQKFLKSKPARILTLVLLVQAATFYGCSRKEITPQNRPLAEVPKQFGSWSLHSEGVVEQEIKDVLKADELLTRSYVNPMAGNAAANLFVAYFKSQRTGRAPHSPKNCLPGSGWTSTVADRVQIPIDGRAPIEANRYIVQKGDAKSLVLYWYQSRDRVVASEYSAKVYVVADAIRYNRSDTALIRVVMPIVGNDEAAAERAAMDFVQAFFTPLRQLVSSAEPVNVRYWT
jgi:EpsI family protein